MRELTIFENKTHAEKLKNILAGSTIESDVRQNKNEDWCVWVLDDQDMIHAKSLLEQWQESTKDPRWATLAAKGNRAIKSVADEERAWKQKQKKHQEKLRQISKETTVGGMTLGLMACCGFFALLTKLGENEGVVSLLTIADFMNAGDTIEWSQWKEVQKGQVWRLFTPCLIHFGFIHLIFNMLWLKDLGTRMEVVENSLKFVALVVFIGVVSNVGQALWSPMNPKFGGMSGVVYGLLGYQWIQGRLNLRRSYTVNKQTMVWMMGWFVLCFTGLMGPIANGAHAVGLFCGCVVGFLSRDKSSRTL